MFLNSIKVILFVQKGNFFNSLDLNSFSAVIKKLIGTNCMISKSNLMGMNSFIIRYFFTKIP